MLDFTPHVPMLRIEMLQRVTEGSERQLGGLYPEEKVKMRQM